MRDRKRVADPAKTVAIEQIGVARLAYGEDEPSNAFGAGNVERNRGGPAKVPIGSIEEAPVRGGEVIAGIDRAGEAGTEAQDGFAIAPPAGVERVASRDEQRFSVADDSALSPNAAAARPGREALDLGRIGSRKR